MNPFENSARSICMKCKQAKIFKVLIEIQAVDNPRDKRGNIIAAPRLVGSTFEELPQVGCEWLNQLIAGGVCVTACEGFKPRSDEEIAVGPKYQKPEEATTHSLEN